MSGEEPSGSESHGSAVPVGMALERIHVRQ